MGTTTGAAAAARAVAAVKVYGQGDAEVRALDGIDADFEEGRFTAIMGPSGSGKSTLMHCLAGLDSLTSGHVFLGETDLTELDERGRTRVRRDDVGFIFQAFNLVPTLTARENIAVGRIENRGDFDRVVDSAEKSLAADVIEGLDEQYEQVLGRRFEGGADLSGGEWQKVALGRAYMRDAELLVLDEPTAALDARAEHEVFERFSELTAGKMAVLISHRFSTVRMADRILVLDGGRIIEDGSHAELLRLDGRYAELFNLQAEGYR